MKLPTSLSPVSDRPISIAHAAVTEAVTQNLLTFCVILIFLSLSGNKLGAEGGAAIAEALKINKTITGIK